MAFSFPADDALGTIYLIHFSAPTTAGHQHYLGWSADVNERFTRHRAGLGAEETRKAVSQGLRLTLAQTWRGTPAQERRIKEERRAVRRGYACLCPFCELHDELAAELTRDLGAPSMRLIRPTIEQRDGRAPRPPVPQVSPDIPIPPPPDKRSDNHR